MNTIQEIERQRLGLRRAMGLSQFCERYNIGRTLVYELIKTGRLRARKIGKRTIIAEDDAEDWFRRLPIVVPKAPQVEAVPCARSA
jgi:excisionase family DNA binding protein